MDTISQFLPIFLFGGGYRVKSVTVSDISTAKRTSYKYGDGILSVIPSLIEPNLDEEVRSGQFTSIDTWVSTGNGTYTISRPHEESLMNYRFNMLGPSPSVGYDKVEVYETDISNNILNGKTIYEYYTAEDYPFEQMINILGDDIIIIDKTGKHGSLKSIEVQGMKNGTDFYTIKKR